MMVFQHSQFPPEGFSLVLGKPSLDVWVSLCEFSCWFMWCIIGSPILQTGNLKSDLISEPLHHILQFVCLFGVGIYTYYPLSGVILRDSHGVAQVRFVTGNKILRILKSKGLAPDLPEDLYHLIKKAVAVRKHLERNRKDKDAKFRLILIESRIHRLARYYKTKRVLPPNWKYESSTASALVA